MKEKAAKNPSLFSNAGAFMHQQQPQHPKSAKICSVTSFNERVEDKFSQKVFIQILLFLFLFDFFVKCFFLVQLFFFSSRDYSSKPNRISFKQIRTCSLLNTRCQPKYSSIIRDTCASIIAKSSTTCSLFASSKVKLECCCQIFLDSFFS